jgi:8-oxo-dGTP pyrophosphatase MutT (NUDIX family)
MTTLSPEPRLAARVLLLHGSRLLLFQGVDRVAGHCWWVTPGGGLRHGESFEAAAARELYEETGLESPIGPCVWTRRHEFSWEGRRLEQHERFFVACIDTPNISPVSSDPYIVAHRWWTAEEICQSADDFAPRRLGSLLPAIVRGDYPRSPIDCGV